MESAKLKPTRIVASHKNAHLRLKRDAGQERAAKKEQCKKLARESIEIGGSTAIIGSGIAASNSLAQGISASSEVVDLPVKPAKAASGAIHYANAAAQGAITAMHGVKLHNDLRSHDLGCSGIPFDEIKEKMDERFTKVDDSLERNKNAIENNAKSLDRNLGAINDVASKTDRNFRGIENNLRAIDRNHDAIERNYGAINQNFQAINRNHDAIKTNYNEIKQVQGQVDRNLGAIERNFGQLKVNEGEIKLVGGKVDRNYGAIKQVSDQVDRNLGAIERNFGQLKINEGEIRLVGGKVDRNYGAIKQVSEQVDRNFDALERNFNQLKINEGHIRIVDGKVDRNFGAIQQVSDEVNRNLRAIESNFEQLKVNEGNIKMVDGKVDRNYGAVQQVSMQVDRNLNAIKDNLKALTTNYQAIKQNYDEVKQVSQKADRNFETIVENYQVTKLNLEAANRNYLAINRNLDRIDRGFSVMLSGFQFIVNRIDDAKNELNKRFDRLQQFMETSRVESAISQIVSFFDVFSFELDGLVSLEHDRLIEKLKARDGTLSILKSVRNPTKGNLYVDLKSIIRQGLAIPKNSDDKMAFVVLDLLYSGTELYTSVLYSLVRSYIYLASDSYDKNDVEKYNEYLSKLEIDAKDFVNSLNGVGKNVGLLQEVKAVFDQVGELEFMKEDNAHILRSVSRRKEGLNLMRSNLDELVRYLPENAPVIKIGFDFSKTNVSTPIGKWKDGDDVSYAIHCEKSGGIYTKVTNWIAYTIHGQANPNLNIGTVQDGVKRFIFRKFNNDHPERVGIIEDSKQTEFRDISQDLYNAVMKQNEKVALNDIRVLLGDGADINAEYGTKGYIMNIAASQGNPRIVSTLIENGADIQATDTDGNAPIHIAVQRGFEGVAEIILKSGAYVNAANDLRITPVHVAAEKGNEEIFTLLMKDGAELNSTSSNGFTPLHTAAAHGSEKIVDLLSPIRSIDVNSASDQGLTPLHLASKSGHDRVVRSLLRNNAIDINSRAKQGITPLHLASMEGNLNVVKLLTSREEKLKANEQSADGFSPLHLASFFKREKVVAELLRIKDIEINSRTRSGMTPLHIAAMKDQLSVVLALLDKNASAEERDNLGHTPLHLAAELGNLAVVAALVDGARASLNVRREDGRTPVQLAILNNRLDVVQFLISKGARINTKDSMGTSSIVLAIRTGKPDMVKVLVDAYKRKSYRLNESLHSAANQGNLDIVKFLVESKAQDLNLRDTDGRTSVQVAAGRGHYDVVRYLAAYKADLSSEDSDGSTVMHYAALSGDVRILEYLKGKEVNLNAANKNTNIPIHLACLSGDIYSLRYLLQENSTDINLQDSEGNNAMHFLSASTATDPDIVAVKFMEKSGASIDSPNKEGYRPLLGFARSSKWSAVRFLIGKGASNDVVNKQGQFALHFAARDGNREMVEFLAKISPGTVNSRDRDGWSPLFWAARYGHNEVLKYLIEEKGAKYDRPDSKGLSILHVAILSGNLDMVKYLVEGTKVNINISDDNSRSPLHLAAHDGNLGVVKYLVENRAAKNALDKDNSTPLLGAASKSHWDVVKYLIENGANTKIADGESNTLAHKCAENGALEILKSLKNLNLNVRNTRDETILHLAVINNHFDIVEYLVGDKGVDIQVKDRLGNSPLHYAASVGNLIAVKYLTEKNSDLDAKNVAGKTPCDLCEELSIARYFIDEKDMGYNSNAFSATENGSLGILKYLIEEQSVNPNAIDGKSKALSHHAAKAGMLNIVKYLVGKKRVDIHRRDKSSKTPMHYAIENGHLEIADYLEEMDNTIPDFASAMIDVARSDNPAVIEYLVSKLVDVEITDSHGNIPLESALNAQDESGNTLLHRAVTLGSLSLVKKLVESGARTSIRNSNGQTPVECAKDQREITEYLIRREGINDVFAAIKLGNLAVVRILIESEKINIDAKDSSGKTLLQCAIAHDHPKIIKYLIEERGAAYDSDIFTAVAEGHLGICKYLIEEKNRDVNSKNKDGSSLLHLASLNGHLDLVKYLVAERANVSMANQENYTPLHAATEKGHMEVVKYLVEKEAKVNAKDKANKTPLDYAIDHDHLEISKYLTDAGGTVHDGNMFIAALRGHYNVVKYFLDVVKQDVNAKDLNDCTALMLAADRGQLKVVKYLVDEKHADVNLAGVKKFGPLHAASNHGHSDIVKYLAERGADLHAKDVANDTPLSLAINSGSIEIIRYLIDERGVAYGGDIFTAAERGELGMIKYFLDVKNQDVNYKDALGWTPLYRASYSGRLSSVEYLVEQKKADLNAKNKYSSTPLHAAAERGHLNVVKYLVGKGAEVNAKDNANKTPLNYAIDNGHSIISKYLIEERGVPSDGDIFSAAKNGQLAVVQYFIEEKNQDVDTKNKDHWTALILAADYGHLKVVKYLVEKGANVNLFSDRNFGPMHAAAYAGHFDIAKYLAEKGAAVNAKDNASKTPLDYAIDRGNSKVSKLLTDLGGVVYDGNIFSAAGRGHINVVKYFLDVKGQDLNAINEKDCTALILASDYGHLKVVKYLVDEKRANVNLTGVKKYSPMHAACNNGHFDIIKYLAEKGADLHAKDVANNTPLSLAINSGSIEIIRYLIDERGVAYGGDIFTAAERGELGMIKYFLDVKNQDVNAKNKDNLTTLIIASLNGRLTVVKYLVAEKHANLNLTNNHNYGPMHAASIRGHAGIVKYLAEKGADLNARDVANNTPLSFAINSGSLEIIKYLIDERSVNYDGDIFTAAEKAQLVMVKYFIEAKNQDVNSKDRLGWTPLLRASYNGHLSLVEYLVGKKGADLNAKNKYDFTSLHAAAEKGHLDVIKYLIGKGAQVSAKDNANKTPLSYAIDNGHSEVSKFLIEVQGVPYDGDILTAAKRGELGMIKYFIEKRSRDIESKNERGAGLLHIAASHGHLNIMRYLVEEKKLNLNSLDNDGRTPLHDAAGSLNLEAVKYLVENGARVDVKAYDGRTIPLLSALEAKKGKSSVTDYLCSFYASCSVRCTVSAHFSSCSYSTSSMSRPVRSIDYQNVEGPSGDLGEHSKTKVRADAKLSDGSGSNGYKVQESGDYLWSDNNDEGILSGREDTSNAADQLNLIDHRDEFVRRDARNLCSRVESHFDEYRGRNVNQCEENIFSAAKSSHYPGEFLKLLADDVERGLEIRSACERKYSSLDGKERTSMQQQDHRAQYLSSCRSEEILARQAVDNQVYTALHKADLWDRAFGLIDGNLVLASLLLGLFGKNRVTGERQVLEFKEISRYHELFCEALIKTEISDEIVKLIAAQSNVTVDISGRDLHDPNLVFSFLFGTKKEISDDLMVWLGDLAFAKQSSGREGERRAINQLIDDENLIDLLDPLVERIKNETRSNEFVLEADEISRRFRKACDRIICICKKVFQDSSPCTTSDYLYNSYRLDFVAGVMRGRGAEEIKASLLARMNHSLVGSLPIKPRGNNRGIFERIKSSISSAIPAKILGKSASHDPGALVFLEVAGTIIKGAAISSKDALDNGSSMTLQDSHSNCTMAPELPLAMRTDIIPKQIADISGCSVFTSKTNVQKEVRMAKK